MRLWSLHPSLLDRQGLTAAWREALLAQAVLAGRTRGYQHHPQLDRFRDTGDPLAHVAAYLSGIAAEADARGYRFDRGRIGTGAERAMRMLVTDSQLAHEWHHLRAKLAARSPQRWAALPAEPSPHPLFDVVPGEVAVWERVPPPVPGGAA